MQKVILFICLQLVVIISISQTIKRISAYDNNYNNNSGIFGITDNGVYEYSWYYQQWLQLPNNGLTFYEDQAQLDEISAFDANSVNPSGVYVISDTAVFVYNYYAELWYPLYNTGLCRIEGIVQLSDLSAHLDIEDDYERIYVKSCDHIYYYNWYMQNWSQLPNTGLNEKETPQTTDFDFSVFPNPVHYNSAIILNLDNNYKGQIKIALFNEQGLFIKEIVNDYYTGGTFRIESSDLDIAPGIYFYEISGDNFTQAKKFIKL
ncbi:MAG: T9SS type A sorting domain-containing protein [Bacteroidales bacterium]|nr:T9SS type A sorting domain-containing protein [Bacteroidales bacterium]